MDSCIHRDSEACGRTCDFRCANTFIENTLGHNTEIIEIEEVQVIDGLQ